MANGAPFFTPTRKWRNQPVNSEAVEKGSGVCASSARGGLRIRIRDRLVKSQPFDIAAELAQRVEAFRRAAAGIAYQVVEPVLAGDDDKMRDAAWQTGYQEDLKDRPVQIDQLFGHRAADDRGRQQE